MIYLKKNSIIDISMQIFGFLHQLFAILQPQGDKNAYKNGQFSNGNIAK